MQGDGRLRRTEASFSVAASVAGFGYAMWAVAVDLTRTPGL